MEELVREVAVYNPVELLQYEMMRIRLKFCRGTLQVSPMDACDRYQKDVT
jgi:hypothetical protein